MSPRRASNLPVGQTRAPGGPLTIVSFTVERRHNRVRLVLDDGHECTLNSDVAAEAGLRAGQPLTAERLRELEGRNQHEACRDAALSFLEFRPRSEAEVRRQLRRKGYPDGVVDSVIVRLREQKLIDDEAFARFWRDNRLAFRPKSRRVMTVELRQKGVSGEVAVEVTQDVDDEAAAYAAAQGKAERLAGLDSTAFREKLYGFLQRRGFDYEVANRVVKRLWLELQDKSGADA